MVKKRVKVKNLNGKDALNLAVARGIVERVILQLEPILVSLPRKSMGVAILKRSEQNASRLL